MDKFVGARYKKFPTEEEAKAFVEGGTIACTKTAGMSDAVFHSCNLYNSC